MSIEWRVRLRLLNMGLQVCEESCREWCSEEGLEFTLGARLAHYIFAWRTKKYLRILPHVDLLPLPSEDEAAWRALSEWRHPQINLNLLQLAIVFGAYQPQWYLWQPVFLQEGNYRDDSCQLVNHPLHLHYRFSVQLMFNLDHIRDELLYERGLIDLTPSRVLKSTDTEASLAASGLPGVSVLGLDVCSLFLSALQKKISREGISAICSPYPQPKAMQVAPFYDSRCLLNVFGKLSGPRAQPSTVELIWSIATSTTRFQSSRLSVLPLCVVNNTPPSLNQELLILLCQCTFSVTDAKLREVRLNDLAQLFWKFSAETKVQTEQAVRFLSTNALKQIIRILQEREAQRSHFQLICPRPSQVLKDQLASRTLQDLCVLTVLEAVRGDARKVWSLEQLPEPLKQLFHIPFLERYEELKAGEQG